MIAAAAAVLALSAVVPAVAAIHAADTDADNDAAADAAIAGVRAVDDVAGVADGAGDAVCAAVAVAVAVAAFDFGAVAVAGAVFDVGVLAVLAVAAFVAAAFDVGALAVAVGAVALATVAAVDFDKTCWGVDGMAISVQWAMLNGVLNARCLRQVADEASKSPRGAAFGSMFAAAVAMAAAVLREIEPARKLQAWLQPPSPLRGDLRHQYRHHPASCKQLLSKPRPLQLAVDGHHLQRSRLQSCLGLPQVLMAEDHQLVHAVPWIGFAFHECDDPPHLQLRRAPLAWCPRGAERGGNSGWASPAELNQRAGHPPDLPGNPVEAENSLNLVHHLLKHSLCLRIVEHDHLNCCYSPCCA